LQRIACVRVRKPLRTHTHAVFRNSTLARRMTDPLLTARAVADTLGVSAETVLRWTRRGELPAIRLPGGAIRYREADLEDWLALRVTPSATLQETRPVTPGGIP
jgi:excisionase family DNA binding protein